MAGKPTKMSLVTEEEQARFRSMAKMIMLCESLERAHSPEKFSTSYQGRASSAAVGVLSSPLLPSSPSAQSPSKRRFLHARDFASTGSHAVDLMKADEVLDYRTTITKQKHYVERFIDAWKGGHPSMVPVTSLGASRQRQLQRQARTHSRICKQLRRPRSPSPAAARK